MKRRTMLKSMGQPLFDWMGKSGFVKYKIVQNEN